MQNYQLRLIVLFISLIVLSVACRPAVENSNVSNSQSKPVGSLGVANPSPVSASNASGTTAAQACYEVKVPGKKVRRAQTFPIDFEPFKSSCFVTLHDPEFTDPPVNSEIAIYKDGKDLHALRRNTPEPDVSETGFPTSGCWVVAVAFQDVNADGLTDVIVAGKCQAKMGDYNENLVYLNNGKFLVTRPGVNVALVELKSIGEILRYIKDNPSEFSLTIDAAPDNR